MNKKGLFLVVLAVALGSSLAMADLNDGLVGHWKLDETSGLSAADSSGTGNDGTLINMTGNEWGAGIVDGALEFAGGEYGWGGGGDVIMINDDDTLDITGDIAIAFWVKMDTFNLNPDFVIKDYGASYGIWYSGGMIFSINESHLVTDTVTFDTGRWIHFVFMRNGSGRYIYVDGEMDANDIETAASGVTSSELRLSTEWYPVDGLMDDVRIYNRALSEAEITTLAETTTNQPPNVKVGNAAVFLDQGGSVQMAASYTDDGKPEPPTYTYQWSQVSGPAVASFDSTTIEDPTITFAVAGVYEFQLTVGDGNADGSGIGQVVAQATEGPIARWNFEDDLTDSTANSFDCSLAGTGDDPNFVAGHIGSKALELYVADASGGKYLEAAKDPAADPNLWDLKYQMSVACWIKDTETESWGTMIAKGSNSWRLHYQDTDPYLSFAAIGTSTTWNGVTDADMSVVDDYWHHVAGVYDGMKMYVYVDGIEDSSVATTGLMNVDDFSPTIGVEINNDSSSLDGPFSGQLDDLRVYSYALTPSQVASLADMANLIPRVDAGADQEVVLQVGSTTLAGSIIDDGKPVAATVLWEKVSGPGTPVFVDDTDPTTGVSFDTAGTYVLSLTADDTTASVSDEVTIEVVEKTCADVISEGLGLPGDVSGPSDVPDCHVDLYDFAAFSANWLKCNDPDDTNCEMPY